MGDAARRCDESGLAAFFDACALQETRKISGIKAIAGAGRIDDFRFDRRFSKGPAITAHKNSSCAQLHGNGSGPLRQFSRGRVRRLLAGEMLRFVLVWKEDIGVAKNIPDARVPLFRRIVIAVERSRQSEPLCFSKERRRTLVELLQQKVVSDMEVPRLS